MWILSINVLSVFLPASGILKLLPQLCKICATLIYRICMQLSGMIIER